MIRWFDTHCHLDLMPDAGQIDVVLARANAAGVDRFVVPGVTGPVAHGHKLSQHAGVKCAWGIHPLHAAAAAISTSVVPWSDCDYQPVAIGECGLDKRLAVAREDQCRLFCWQIDLAKRHRLPLIVHLVGYYELAFQLLSAAGQLPAIVMHSWSGSAEMAARFAGIGAYFSLSASCLKNPLRLQRLISCVGLESMLLETDSPDMKPVFWQGNSNEPAALAEIGAHISALAEIEVAKLAEIMYTNSIKLFK